MEASAEKPAFDSLPTKMSVNAGTRRAKAPHGVVFVMIWHVPCGRTGRLQWSEPSRHPRNLLMIEPRCAEPIDPAVPRWPQFGMRTLFAFVTACCVLFALVGLMGQLWALAVGWMVLMTAVHVAANAWGIRLRQGRRVAALDETGEAPRRGELPPPLAFVPATRLRERASFSWLRVAVSVFLAIVSGIAGSGLLWLVAWGHIDYGSLSIAGISAAVIGCILGFLISSFLEVSLRAWWEAQQGCQSRS